MGAKNSSGQKAFSVGLSGNELPRLVQHNLIPIDVSARIHAFHVAQAVYSIKELFGKESAGTLNSAIANLSRSAKANHANGSPILLRGMPVSMVDAHLRTAKPEQYFAFCKNAKREIQHVLEQAGAKAREKFNPTTMIDFTTPEQKEKFRLMIPSIIRAIDAVTKKGPLRPPERMLHRDAKLDQAREELTQLEKIEQSAKRKEWFAKQNPNYHPQIIQLLQKTVQAYLTHSNNMKN